MRVELRDGMWAELRERITHGQDKTIKRAIAAGRLDPTEAWTAETVLVREFVKAWDVKDPDGVVIPLTDENAIDRAPDDVIDRLVTEASIVYTGATEPNPPTAPSSADS